MQSAFNGQWSTSSLPDVYVIQAIQKQVQDTKLTYILKWNSLSFYFPMHH